MLTPHTSAYRTEVLEQIRERVVARQREGRFGVAGMVQIPHIPAQWFGRRGSPVVHLSSVKVYVGDREISDTVRVQLDDHDVRLTGRWRGRVLG